MQETDIRKLITDMPKAENHVHLEGSIRPEMLIELAKKNKADIPFQTTDEAITYIVENTKSLDTFINVFNVVNAVLQKPEDFYDLLMDFAKQAYEDNIIYREVMVNFAVHEARGLNAEEIVEALARGTKDAQERYGLRLRFIAELDRSKDEAYAIDLVERMVNYRETLPLVAIGWALGLKGKEQDNYTAKEHQQAFLLAKKNGFFTTAHCGEAQGPESVRDVLKYLKPDRIDHGVRASEDDELLKLLADQNILLAVCPTTNIMIGLYEDLALHPISKLLSHGVKVSISTDDPAYILSSLSEEIACISIAQQFNKETIIEIARQAFLDSFDGEDLLPILDEYLLTLNK